MLTWFTSLGCMHESRTASHDRETYPDRRFWPRWASMGWWKTSVCYSALVFRSIWTGDYQWGV